MADLEHLFSNDGRGTLVPGIHTVTWHAFRSQFAVNNLRRLQIEGLSRAMYALQSAGCRTVYVDGSFITHKEFPGDYDALWDEQGVDITALDPTFRDFKFQRKAQKEKYLGEWFPMRNAADISGTLFMDFFQLDRDNLPKGIIRFDLEGWNND